MKKTQINEVRQLQKIAGILKENLNKGLRVYEDEGEAILEFTDVFSMEELEKLIKDREATDPIFARNVDILGSNIPYFLWPVEDEHADEEPDYRWSFEEWVDSVKKEDFGDDDE